MPRSSRSRSPSRHSYRSVSRRSCSEDRRVEPKRNSRSRSGSRRNSRSPSPRDRRSRSGSRGSHRRSSRSPPRRRYRDFYDSKTNAPPNKCIGVFGLSLHTKEDTLVKLFDRYPGFESVKLVKEYQTGRSRGFAFITYETKEDAAYAREKCNGQEVEGYQIRIDFSANDLRGGGGWRGGRGGGRSPPRWGRRPPPRYRSRSRSYGRRRSYSRSPRRRY